MFLKNEKSFIRLVLRTSLFAHFLDTTLFPYFLETDRKKEKDGKRQSTCPLSATLGGK